jgi:hypothetical protein
MQTARMQRREVLLAHRQPPPLGGCTRETLRCADARDYHRELRSCCRAHIRQIVVDAVALLEEHGVTYWVDYGTLLGAVRNPLTTWADYYWLPQEGKPEGLLAPGVIPHDKDADFGFLAPDFQKLMRVRAALERQGYLVLVQPGHCKVKVRLSAVNQTNLDLFGWQDRLGILHRPSYISVDAYKGRHFPKEAGFPLERISWEDMSLPAPKDPEAFCAFRYGPNWRKPIPANHDGVRRGG